MISSRQGIGKFIQKGTALPPEKGLAPAKVFIMKKLLIYGDSILRGITYSEEAKKHKLCTGYKLPTLAALGYEVINHSRMGATVDRGLDMFDYTVAECDKDTTVIFDFGGNDCDYDWAAISADPLAVHLPHTPEEKFRATYGEMLNRAFATGAEVYMCNLVPMMPERYLSFISKDRSRENIMSWLGDITMLYRFQEHYNLIVEDIARTAGCPLIDLRTDFLLSHRCSSLLSLDGIHPSEEGHDLIETLLREKLAKSDGLKKMA